MRPNSAQEATLFKVLAASRQLYNDCGAVIPTTKEHLLMGTQRELLASTLRRLHDALHDWEKQLHHHAAELSLDELRVLRADLHGLQQKVEDEIERRVVLR